jgi:galactose mutarotase-like enzyme
MSWRVGGRELLWQGDPAHWPRRAPILFPVIGESAGGRIRIGGAAYPMPRHGFVRDARFTLVERGADNVRLRLVASQETFAHYPFRFQLDVVARLRPSTLAMAFEVANADTRDMPYALGFHPAFPWPLDGDAPEGHAIEFEREERPEIPDITAAGLLRTGGRRLPLEGRRLALDPELFAADALVLLNATSRSLRFAAPSGAALDFAVEDFPHFALWTKPTAPFLSIEAWTSHADPEGFAGDLFERPFMRRLAPGTTARHHVTLSWSPSG